MDIQSYLNRIQYRGSLEPKLQNLSALQKTHMQTVPFENLSVHYKQPILLNEKALYNKIVKQNRGGFCYELNGLFAWLLRGLGYKVELLAAGVSTGTGGFGPEFDHMTLLVHLEEDYLVDVGFGDSFQEPLRVNFQGEQRQDGVSYQLSAEGEALVLSKQNNLDESPNMQPQYRFKLNPHQMKEYEGMCQYHQTSPASHFTQKRICSRATENGRYSLSDLKLIVTESGRKQERILRSEDDFEAVLKDYFSIDLNLFPSNTRKTQGDALLPSES